MIETDANSASQSVELLDQVREDWEAPVPILEVIIDHRSEFINTRQDERPCLDHEFEAYLHDHEIEHTLCEVGRLQSNGTLFGRLAKLAEYVDGNTIDETVDRCPSKVE